MATSFWIKSAKIGKIISQRVGGSEIGTQMDAMKPRKQAKLRNSGMDIGL